MFFQKSFVKYPKLQKDDVQLFFFYLKNGNNYVIYCVWGEGGCEANEYVMRKMKTTKRTDGQFTGHFVFPKTFCFHFPKSILCI